MRLLLAVLLVVSAGLTMKERIVVPAVGSTVRSADDLHRSAINEARESLGGVRSNVGTIQSAGKPETASGRSTTNFIRVHRGSPVTKIAMEPVTVNPEPDPIDIPGIIRISARAYGLDEEMMLRVAWCESRFNPDAIGAAGERGIFQFMSATWAANSVRAGWAGASPHDVRAASEVASWMFARGQAHQWTCR